MMQNVTPQETVDQFFKENGYCKIRLYDTNPIYEVRTTLLEELRKLTSQPNITLETYHQYVTNDQQHTDIQVKLTELLRANHQVENVISQNIELFKQLVGANIDIQLKPYLRIVRPGKSKDNIGYHRDTFYGGSPYELSVLIPFVNLDAGATLRVEPGSHLKPESDIPLIQTQSEDVQKGSNKHSIGFLYAPKIIDPAYQLHMQPVPLEIGEALVFSLATLHGTEGNDSSVTRWSVDMRIVDAHAPGIENRGHYYRPLTSAPSTVVAEAYAHANEKRATLQSASDPTPPISTSVASAAATSHTNELQRWNEVRDRLGTESVTLGPYFSYQLRHTPRHILYSLSFHKFAAKMIGAHKEILDVGCSEGLGTTILAEHAKRLVGVDIDVPAITSAQQNFANDKTSFVVGDMLTDQFSGPFDAVVSFDVIEHIFPENAKTFFANTVKSLRPDGLTIVGTPNQTADQYASATTRSGHINLYTAERLREELQQWFSNVFIFSVNDEVVHTGFYPMAHYLLAMGVGPKQQS